MTIAFEQLSAKLAEASWPQKIRAIKIAAEKDGKAALRKVTRYLDVGVEHMGYKDFKEFGCSCAEEYIFNEALHLIDELDLAFEDALQAVLIDDIGELPKGWTESPTGLICSNDAVTGGIIDKNIVERTWFVIFNHEDMDIIEHVESRKAAILAHQNALANKELLD